MIVRILGEGQWTVDRAALADLNGLDDAVEKAVATGDEAQLTAALHTLLEEIRTAGTPVPDAALEDSDLIFPSIDSTLAEVKEMLNESSEGLIPG